MGSTFTTKAFGLALAALMAAIALTAGVRAMRSVDADMNPRDTVAVEWVAGTVRLAVGEPLQSDELREIKR